MTSRTKKRNIDEVDIEEFERSMKKLAISQDHSSANEQVKQTAQRSKKRSKKLYQLPKHKDTSLIFKIERNRLEAEISALLKSIRNSTEAYYQPAGSSIPVSGNATASTSSLINQKKRVNHNHSISTNSPPESGRTSLRQQKRDNKKGPRKRSRETGIDSGAKRMKMQDDSLNIDAVIALFAKMSL